MRRGSMLSRAATRTLSRAHSDVVKRCLNCLEQLRATEGLISPVSKSISLAKARGKPKARISSSRMGKISSERAASSSRSAARPRNTPPERSRERGLSGAGAAVRAVAISQHSWLTARGSAAGGHATNSPRLHDRLGPRFPFSQLRSRHEAGHADCLGVFQISVNGGDDDARFHRDQVNADQRNSDPGINDDAFVQHAVENVNETSSARYSLYRHFGFSSNSAFSPCSLRRSRDAGAQSLGLAGRSAYRSTCRRQRPTRRGEVGVELPPVQPDLFSLVHGTNQKPD